MSLINTRIKVSNKENSIGSILQSKIGEKNNYCTIKGLNTDLFLKLKCLRSIESLQKNKGAIVKHENGNVGRVYFKSYPIGDKIAFFNNNKRELVRPQHLTILSFF